MKGILSKLVVIVILAAVTITAYGGCFYGWFLPKPLEKPVSLRDGSTRARTYGYGLYFTGRRHYGGGYGRGK
ncbi:MAG: hypothetical protein P8182_02475 [Deltaproteobacteria bacterium]